MKRVQVLSTALVIVLILPGLVFAYGDGAATGAVKSGLDSGKMCRCETLEKVREGQRWHTRPEAIKKTAYEFVSSFPDADRNLIDSYETGALTKEEMREILQWLKDNRMYMSDKALTVLNELSGAPDSSDTKSPATSSTAQSSQTTATDSNTAPLSPQDKIKKSISRKLFAYFLQCPPVVTNMYDQLSFQNPNKNHFQLNNMVYRKMFTEEERNIIQSDLKVYIGVMNRIDKLTK